jgi:hypothetical protein
MHRLLGRLEEVRANMGLLLDLEELLMHRDMGGAVTKRDLASFLGPLVPLCRLLDSGLGLLCVCVQYEYIVRCGERGMRA